ncbi:hypothetical protein NA57DRAFT_59655 [Rhizodiscina lignyota]|uniref:Uncharacterized protein n=1 Tax=Rhizodiscina lignyota TaxID=1504668 RepID=A0A9P4M3F5_9PEZI|nr:hypothetical protein NA57DRAFT_59655 [Rhizodiscina lignyota]
MQDRGLDRQQGPIFPSPDSSWTSKRQYGISGDSSSFFRATREFALLQMLPVPSVVESKHRLAGTPVFWLKSNVASNPPNGRVGPVLSSAALQYRVLERTCLEHGLICPIELGLNSDVAAPCFRRRAPRNDNNSLAGIGGRPVLALCNITDQPVGIELAILGLHLIITSMVYHNDIQTFLGCKLLGDMNIKRTAIFRSRSVESVKMRFS